MPKQRWSTERMRVAALLRGTRVDAGLTQEELAKRTDLIQSEISRVESGERSIELHEIAQICRACGISLVQFVTQLEDSAAG